MAKTGFITSSGIQQVFTSGPFLGSVVSSSYISGGIAFGPSINFNQNFISGSVDILSPCTTIFQRYYQDLVACPPNGCTPPTLTRAFIYCDPYDYKYSVPYNSGSSTATYTVMEYSTSNTFTSNTSSVIYNNSSPSLLPIDVSDLLYLPTAYTTLYFRARNYCSNGATSSYSNVVFAPICDAPAPIPTTMTLNSLSPPELDEGWRIYTIKGAPGTKITYSTSNFNNGTHGGTISMVDLSKPEEYIYLSFTIPKSGELIIPSSGEIILQIDITARPPINAASNCVTITITFLNILEGQLEPDGNVILAKCAAGENNQL